MLFHAILLAATAHAAGFSPSIHAVHNEAYHRSRELLEKNKSREAAAVCEEELKSLPQTIQLAVGDGASAIANLKNVGFLRYQLALALSKSGQTHRAVTAYEDACSWQSFLYGPRSDYFAGCVASWAATLRSSGQHEQEVRVEADLAARRSAGASSGPSSLSSSPYASWLLLGLPLDEEDEKEAEGALLYVRAVEEAMRGFLHAHTGKGSRERSLAVLHSIAASVGTDVQKDIPAYGLRLGKELFRIMYGAEGGGGGGGGPVQDAEDEALRVLLAQSETLQGELPSLLFQPNEDVPHNAGAGERDSQEARLQAAVSYLLAQRDAIVARLQPDTAASGGQRRGEGGTDEYGLGAGASPATWSDGHGNNNVPSPVRISSKVAAARKGARAPYVGEGTAVIRTRASGSGGGGAETYTSVPIGDAVPRSLPEGATRVWAGAKSYRKPERSAGTGGAAAAAHVGTVSGASPAGGRAVEGTHDAESQADGALPPDPFVTGLRHADSYDTMVHDLRFAPRADVMASMGGDLLHRLTQETVDGPGRDTGKEKTRGKDRSPVVRVVGKGGSSHPHTQSHAATARFPTSDALSPYRWIKYRNTLLVVLSVLHTAQVPLQVGTEDGMLAPRLWAQDAVMAARGASEGVRNNAISAARDSHAPVSGSGTPHATDTAGARSGARAWPPYAYVYAGSGAVLLLLLVAALWRRPHRQAQPRPAPAPAASPAVPAIPSRARTPPLPVQAANDKEVGKAMASKEGHKTKKSGVGTFSTVSASASTSVVSGSGSIDTHRAPATGKGKAVLGVVLSGKSNGSSGVGNPAPAASPPSPAPAPTSHAVVSVPAHTDKPSHGGAKVLGGTAQDSVCAAMDAVPPSPPLPTGQGKGKTRGTPAVPSASTSAYTFVVPPDGAVAVPARRSNRESFSFDFDALRIGVPIPAPAVLVPAPHAESSSKDTQGRRSTRVVRKGNAPFLTAGVEAWRLHTSTGTGGTTLGTNLFGDVVQRALAESRRRLSAPPVLEATNAPGMVSVGSDTRGRALRAYATSAGAGYGWIEDAEDLRPVGGYEDGAVGGWDDAATCSISVFTQAARHRDKALHGGRPRTGSGSHLPAPPVVPRDGKQPRTKAQQAPVSAPVHPAVAVLPPAVPAAPTHAPDRVPGAVQSPPLPPVPVTTPSHGAAVKGAGKGKGKGKGVPASPPTPTPTPTPTPKAGGKVKSPPKPSPSSPQTSVGPATGTEKGTPVPNAVLVTPPPPAPVSAPPTHVQDGHVPPNPQGQEGTPFPPSTMVQDGHVYNLADGPQGRGWYLVGPVQDGEGVAPVGPVDQPSPPSVLTSASVPCVPVLLPNGTVVLMPASQVSSMGMTVGMGAGGMPMGMGYMPQGMAYGYAYSDSSPGYGQGGAAYPQWGWGRYPQGQGLLMPSESMVMAAHAAAQMVHAQAHGQAAPLPQRGGGTGRGKQRSGQYTSTP